MYIGMFGSIVCCMVDHWGNIIVCCMRLGGGGGGRGGGGGCAAARGDGGGGRAGGEGGELGCTTTSLVGVTSHPKFTTFSGKQKKPTMAHSFRRKDNNGSVNTTYRCVEDSDRLHICSGK
jgi:hypothetical protein